MFPSFSFYMEKQHGMSKSRTVKGWDAPLPPFFCSQLHAFWGCFSFLKRVVELQVMSSLALRCTLQRLRDLLAIHGHPVWLLQRKQTGTTISDPIMYLRSQSLYSVFQHGGIYVERRLVIYVLILVLSKSTEKALLFITWRKIWILNF